MDQVFIKDLLVRGVIGINPDEREHPQDILINVTIFMNTNAAAKSDRIEDCVNYRTISKKVTAHTEKVARYTVEALASDLSDICLEQPGVEGVRIRVEKPGAVRFTRSVGVEIERFRSK